MVIKTSIKNDIFTISLYQDGENINIEENEGEKQFSAPGNSGDMLEADVKEENETSAGDGKNDITFYLL